MYLSDQIKKNEMGRACSTYRGNERCIQGVGGEIERKTPLGRPRPRWEDNIKLDLKEIISEAWTRRIWLRIGIRGGLLRTR